MIEEKQAIILSEGTPVELHNLGGTVTEAVALIGRATSQFNSMLSLESNRRAQVLPEVPMVSGDTMKQLATGDSYIIVGVMEEVIYEKRAALIGHMLICNTSVDVSSLEEVVNARNDVVKTDVVKYSDLLVHTQVVTADLRLQDPGLVENADYVIYAPDIDIDPLDKILMKVGARTMPLKAVHVDYISFPGLAKIQAATETRK